MTSNAYLSTVEIHKEIAHFSAGHFTIFSATEREPMHGHSYAVNLAITATIGDNGLSFDYRYYKTKIKNLCSQLHLTFLLPGRSPFLDIAEDEAYYYCTFNQKKMPFLKEDATILPVSNISVEELSRWFVQHLTGDTQELEHNHIKAIEAKVFSGTRQSGSHRWTCE